MMSLRKPFSWMLLILLLASALLSSCGVSAASVETSTPTPEPTFTSIPTLTPIPDPEPSAADTYTLSAVLDLSAHTVQVQETIRYTNRQTEALPELILAAEANAFTGAFQLSQLTWQDGQAVENTTLDRNQLKIPLKVPLAPGETLEIHTAYQITLPHLVAPGTDVRPTPFGYTEHQTNLVDWILLVAPYQPGKGWLIHEPSIFGEHQVYSTADYVVDLTVSPAVDGLVVAASAPETKNGDVRHYELANARNFVLSASSEYQVNTRQVGDVTVLGYNLPLYPNAAKQALEDTARALEVYQRTFGPYPHKTLSVVEADFLDGMEYDGLYFLSDGFYNLYDGTPKGYLTLIAAHETAHQWWYAQVGDDQALEPWLDEAMCTYSERIFIENVYPDLLSWWWSYRVNYYQPEGWINQAVYDYPGFTPYRNAVYLRGAQFLEDLRQRIGDDAFFAFLQDFVRQYKDKIATSADFFTVLSQHTSADLSDLTAKYFKP